MLIYDKADKQIGEIVFDATFICAFEENGNIKVVYVVFDWEDENNAGTVYADTYSKNGKLLERKDITKKAENIDEYGVFSRCYPNSNGYFFVFSDSTGEKVLAYDKDWNYVDELSFNFQSRVSFVGNCGLIKDNRYIDVEYISRFNIGDIEIVPKVLKPEKINISKAKVSGIKNKTYTGKALKQSLTLTYNGKKLTLNTDYTVSYSSNKNVGTAKIKIKGIGKYTGTVTKTFKITKAANTIKVSTKTKAVKASKLKKAKVLVKKAITVKSNKGSVTYKKVSGSKYLTINKKGVITVKKGKYKKGIYKLKVTITAKGNSNYKKKSITKKVNIKIK
ncbi:MAG: hypothetical protein IJV39_01195 [Ruminococcus sp.]|nr:hypothetical protein [Ruminococcus sp.]